MSTDDKNIMYKSYSVEDLLQDDAFITAMTKPDKESEKYWNDAVREGKVDIHEYKLARYYIESVQVQPEKISNDEIFSLWENIEVLNKQNLKKKRNHSFFYLSAVAGVAALCIVVFSWNSISSKSPANEEISIIQNVKAPDTNTEDIQLILADNELLALEGREAEIIHHESGIAINNKKMDSEKKPINNKKVAYNQLIVPVGKHSMLTFEEGSKIWVNAATRVVYPSTFDKEKREIYVDGEAYLEVSPDGDRPFIVKTKKLDIEVLGTSFNVMAYEKDTLQSIVLVSGSVKVNTGGKQKAILSPNDMLTFSEDRQQIKKVNVDDYISWRLGIYQYNSESLGAILTRLSRYYGQEIECSMQASQFKCSGKLDLKDDLFTVLNGMTQTVPVKCNIDNGKYMITNK